MFDLDHVRPNPLDLSAVAMPRLEIRDPHEPIRRALEGSAIVANMDAFRRSFDTARARLVRHWAESAERARVIAATPDPDEDA